MNFLVYLGIRNYDLEKARAALVERSAALLLKEWRAHGHVHENYCADSGSDMDLFVVVDGDGRIEFQGKVCDNWYKYWMFSRAEIVEDPSGIGKRNQDIALGYFARNPGIDKVWE